MSEEARPRSGMTFHEAIDEQMRRVLIHRDAKEVRDLCRAIEELTRELEVGIKRLGQAPGYRAHRVPRIVPMRTRHRCEEALRGLGRLRRWRQATSEQRLLELLIVFYVHGNAP